MNFATNNISRATQFCLYLLIALIPFSVRMVIDTSWNYQTGAYSDFTSLSIYLSDLVLLMLIGFTWNMKRQSPISRTWKLLSIAAVSWLILELLIQPRTNLPLQFYFAVRIALLILFAAGISKINVSREKLAWLFIILGSMQSIIAGIQFTNQKSIGLYILGESHLSPDILGVAKIVSHGTKLIRGYGTFPHPNLLAAFLVVSFGFNIYLLAKSYQSPHGGFSPRGIWLHLALFLNIFGIFLSFSRAGMIALGISALIWGASFMWNKQKGLFIRILPAILISIALSVAILGTFLATRGTISDSATKERVLYNKIGVKIVEDKPVFGTGPGQSVLHMKQYSPVALEPWEIQPVHNYYLILAAEWGIGGIILLLLIILPVFTLFKLNLGFWNFTLMASGASILILFAFDHYFYTIWPTQLLLWTIVGLSLGGASHETIYDTSSPRE